MIKSSKYIKNRSNEVQDTVGSMLPSVIISKVTLGESGNRDEPGNIMTSYKDSGPQSSGTEPPLMIRVDLHVIPLQKQHSCLTDEKTNKHLQIVLQETINDYTRIKRLPIEPNFVLEQIKNQGFYYSLYESFFPDLNPEKVKYTAWIELDPAGYSDELGLGLGNKNGPKHRGPQHSATVIEGGNSKSGFQTTTDHEHSHKAVMAGNNGMALTNERRGRGKVHTHKITNGRVEAAGNPRHIHYMLGTQINDYRTIAEINKIDLEVVSTNKSDLMKIIKTSQPKENIKILSLNSRDPVNMFSDILFSRDDEANNRFFFSINMREIMKKYSVFGKIFTKKSSFSKFIQILSPTISSLKIYRKRIEGNPETGANYLSKVNLEEAAFFNSVTGETNAKQLKDFNDEKSDDLIVFSYQKVGNNTITPIRHPLDSPIESMIGCSIEENTNIVNNAKEKGIRHFSAVDHSVQFMTNGYFQYRIELEIYDPTIRILKKYLKQVIDSENTLTRYYNRTMQGDRGIKNPFGNPHTNASDDYTTTRKSKSTTSSNFQVKKSAKTFLTYDFGGVEDEKILVSDVNSGIRPKQFQKGQYVPGNFNMMVNSFSPSLQGPSGDGMVSVLRQAISSYLEVLNFFAVETIQSGKYFQSLMEIVSPKTGTPGGIETAIALIQNLKNRIQQFMSLVTTPSLKGTDEGSQLLATKSHIEGGDNLESSMISIDHKFSEVYNADISRYMGFDFLDIGPKNNFGLKQITRKEFTNFAEDENKKLFNSFNSDLSISRYTPRDTNLPTFYSYFTPSRISLNKETQLNFKNKDGTYSFGTKEKYDEIAKSVFFSKTEISSKSKSSAILNYTRKTVDETKKRGKASKADEPFNISEQDKLLKKIDIKNELESARDIAQWFGENGCVTVVERETDSKNITPLKTSYNSEAYADKTKNYIEMDLNMGKKLQVTRTANPLLTDLLFATNEDVIPSMQNYILTSGDSKIKQTFEDWSNNKQSPSKFLQNAPNPIKVLFKSNEKSMITNKAVSIREDIIELFNTNINRYNRNLFRYKFETIDVAEVLTGYEKTNSKNQVIMPIWEPISEKVLNSSKGQSLLCRIRPYESSVFGIKRNKDYELPTYDEVFIIKGE